VWNFYTFVLCSYLHLNAKRHLINFKYDEVTDILTWPPSDFRALNNVWVETQQTSIAETTQWTVCLMSGSRFECSKCPPLACTHLSRSTKLLTALLMGSCDRLSQIICDASLSSMIDLGFMKLVIGFHHRIQKWWSTGFRSGEFGDHWSFLMNSVLLTWSHSVRYVSVVDRLPMMTADQIHYKHLTKFSEFCLAN